MEQLNGMVGNGSDLFIGYPIQMYYGYVSDGVFLDENDIKSWKNVGKMQKYLTEALRFFMI